MLNERLTENLVQAGFGDVENFRIELQQSEDPKIAKLLEHASKSGKGRGYPEFIIRSDKDPNLLIVIECKADATKLESPKRDKYSSYAVDGALLYSSFLSEYYDVISIGAAGQRKKDFRLKTFLQLRNAAPKPLPLKTTDLQALRQAYIYDDSTKKQRYEDLLDYTTELNNKLHLHKIPEDKRSLLISGILIALEQGAFRKAYREYSKAEDLVEGLVNALVMRLRTANVQPTKISTLTNAYSFIRTNATLSKDLFFTRDLIEEVDQKINSFVKTYKFYDVFGEFYTEFLRYANADKGLGIVLTPKHITELFCKLAGVNKDSIVFDNCCGTGGFLISAMRLMLHEAKHDASKESDIKSKQIVGIEYQDTLFPLLCSNMIIHGDGKTNLFNEDCFKVNVYNSVRVKYKPTVGFLNPPFKTDKHDREELEFVLNNLEGLVPGGVCVALLPMSCVLAQKGTGFLLKEKLLEQHTLEAVLSLPDELFYNSKTSTVTCAIVVRAHQKHPANKETYFGYWKDDGFVKRKNKGRIDGGKWEEICKKWVDSYTNKKEVPGLSVMHHVTAADEWCAEAYMQTDYSTLTEADFIRTVKQYVAFQFLQSRHDKGK